MLKRNVQKNAQMHLNVTPSIIFFHVTDVIRFILGVTVTSFRR